jgi:hypothetical protein
MFEKTIFKVSEVTWARTPIRQNRIYRHGIFIHLNTQVRIDPPVLKSALRLKWLMGMLTTKGTTSV